MANKFYAPGEQRAEKVNDLFAAIAPRYDCINDLQSFGLHRSWKRRLVRLAQVKHGEKALDLCCGTGDVAFALARDGAETTGLDFSAPMLAVAQGRKLQIPIPKLQASDLATDVPANPQFLQGDALRTSFADASFDIVTISYGLRNLASVEGGLREMLRVARPGGRLLVLDFGKPDNAVLRSLYFAYLRGCVPLFGKLFCGDSATHAYIWESLEHYPAQRGVAASMEQLGCRNVRIVNLLGGVMSINYGEKG
jgi:demethylmenaquinone methyltransferase/2-methoxy-6-polyprenyl-1,4-benzoquinol methylase